MDPAPDALASTIQALPDKILEIRGQRVMLDSDLAELFGVPTKRFNEQIKATWKGFRRISCLSLQNRRLWT